MNYHIIKYLTIILIICAVSSSVKCQYYSAQGSRSAGMGRTSTTLSDIWSTLNNQAGMALIDKPKVGVYYETSFMLKQLSTKSLCVAIPSKFGVLGASFTYFGYNLYNIQKTGLAYSKSFGSKFRAGVQLDYLQTKFGNNYGKKANVTFEIGIQVELSEQLTVGIWTFNPILVKLDEYTDEQIPAVLRVGLLWQPSASLIITVETEKNTAVSPLIVRCGLEYIIKEKFYIRTGSTTFREIFSLGAGANLKYVKLDFSAIMHETLGFSPQMSVTGTL